MNYIYGQLNQKVVKVEYEGTQSDTTLTRVNNKECTIGVDVRCVPYSLLINDGAKQVSFDGSNQVEFTLHNYTISQVDTPSEENIYEYVLKNEKGEVVGDTISIPAPISNVELTQSEGHFYLDFYTDGTLISRVLVDDFIMSASSGDGYIQVVRSDNDYVISLDVEALKGELNIPTKTSDLTNDSGFITGEALPTKLSDLTNDEGFITIDSVPTKVSDLTNDAGFITIDSVPTKVSELTNDEGYITSADIPSVDQTFDGTSELAQSGVAIKSQLDTKQGNLSQAQLDAVNSGITSTKLGNIETTLGNQTSSISSIGESISTINSNIGELQDDISDEVTARENAISGLEESKQDVLEAGNNIQINGSVISATDTTYSAGNGLSLDGTQFSVDTTTIAEKSDIQALEESKQDKLTFDSVPTEESNNPVTSDGIFSALSEKQGNLTAGANISIENNTISATDTTYSAGENVSIDSENVISAIDTTYDFGYGLVVDESSEDSDEVEEISVDTSVIATKEDLDDYQGKLVAGENITIDPETNTISASTSGAFYDAGYGLVLDEDSGEEDIHTFSIDETIVATKDDLATKQDVLTAGDGITIDGDTISAEGKEYKAGYGLNRIGEDEDTFQVDISKIATQNDLTSIRASIEEKQDALTEAQQSAVNSGITQDKVVAYDDHLNNDIIHITEEERDLWNSSHIAPDGEINIEFNGDAPSTMETKPLNNIVVGNKNYKVFGGGGESSASFSSGGGFLNSLNISPLNHTTIDAGKFYGVNMYGGNKVDVHEGDTISYLYFNTDVTPELERLDFTDMSEMSQDFEYQGFAPICKFVCDDQYEWRSVKYYENEPLELANGMLWLDSSTLKKYNEGLEDWVVKEYETEEPSNPEVGTYWLDSGSMYIYSKVYRNLISLKVGGWDYTLAKTVAFAYNNTPRDDRFYVLNGVLKMYDNGAWTSIKYTLDNTSPVEGQYYLQLASTDKYTLKQYTSGDWVEIFYNKTIHLMIEEPYTDEYYMDCDDSTYIATYMPKSMDGSAESVDDFIQIVIPFSKEKPTNIGHIWWRVVDSSTTRLETYLSAYYIAYTPDDYASEDESIADASATWSTICYVTPISLPNGTPLFLGWYTQRLNLTAERERYESDTTYNFRVDSIQQNAFIGTCIYESYQAPYSWDIWYVGKSGTIGGTSSTDAYGLPIGQLVQILTTEYMKTYPHTQTYSIQTSDWVEDNTYAPFTHTYTTDITNLGSNTIMTSNRELVVVNDNAVLFATTGLSIVDIVDVYDGGQVVKSQVVFGVTNVPSDYVSVKTRLYDGDAQFLGIRLGV